MRFVPNKREDPRKPFFLTVGAAVPEKNVPFLIRALARRKDTSWPLVWVANVAEEGHLNYTRRLAEDLGVRLDIRVDVSHHELLSLYREAALFLYAPRLEPFGLAPLEAAACGLPVVAVAEAGTRETVSEGENGFLVAADEAAFAAKIDEVLKQPELLRSMASSARAFVRARWSLDEATNRLEGIADSHATPTVVIPCRRATATSSNTKRAIERQNLVATSAALATGLLAACRT